MLGDEEEGDGGATAPVRWGSVTLLAVVGLAAVVTAGRDAADRGPAGWVVVGLAAAGVAGGLATLVRSAPGPDAWRVAVRLAAWVVVLAATVVAWWGLVGAVVPDDPVDRLVWTPPGHARYTAALLTTAVLATLTVAVLAAVRAGRRRPRRVHRGPGPVVVALAVGLATVAVATGAGDRWAAHTAGLATQGLAHRHGTPTSAMASQDAYQDGADGAAGPGAQMRRLWSGFAADRAFLVRGTGLVMTTRIGEPGHGSTGIVVLDAATGRERWHLLLPGDVPFGGVAVSPRSGRVIVVFRNVAVGLDLYTGAELWHRVLTGDPVDGSDNLVVFEVVGAPVTAAPDPLADRVVPAFSWTLVVEEHVIQPSGEDDAGKVMTLDTDGAAHLIERPPAARCRYSVDYAPDDPTLTLLRDGGFAGCGPRELGGFLDDRRVELYELDDAAGCACPLHDLSAAGNGPLRHTLLRFLPSQRALTVDDLGHPGEPFTLPADTVDATMLPPRPPSLAARLVVETDGRGSHLLDLDGKVVAAVGPLPGSAYRGVVAPNGWYRFEALGGSGGRIDVVDPATLRAGRPGPTVPCREITEMSAADGRLLVACDTGDYYVFGR